MAGVDAAGEFETIRKLFAPLAHPDHAWGLTDDVAVMPTRPGYDLALTKDAIVEGVHFLAEDPLDTVAQKLLRVNLSDLAAKGCEPFGYLLACHWSPRCGWPEREAFAAGLAVDQAAFGVHLLGGDTVRTPGPASFSATMLGWAPKSGSVTRGGAKPGHGIYVTGTIGDGWLGLQAARGRLSLDRERIEALAERYRRPTPRLAFGQAVQGLATAIMDVSDGLIGDLAHIANASGVAASVQLESLPRSAAAMAWFDTRSDPEAALETLATGGDDYELLLTAHPSDEAALKREADRQLLRLTRVGTIAEGRGVTAAYLGEPVEIRKPGWTHD